MRESLRVPTRLVSGYGADEPAVVGSAGSTERCRQRVPVLPTRFKTDHGANSTFVVHRRAQFRHMAKLPDSQRLFLNTALSCDAWATS